MTSFEMVLTIGAACAATVLTRALPFWAFPAGRETPRFVRYLGNALPGAVFGLLVVYCLKDVSLFTGSFLYFRDPFASYSPTTLSVIQISLSILPQFIRLAQNLRRYHDSKYASSIEE